jgi:uncharacterized protein YjbI with pentapeptide repeats
MGFERVVTTVDEILERYRRGERDFARAELPDGASFRGQDLSEAVFDEGWLSAADFSSASLRGASFKRTHLKCCVFDLADLTDADLREAGIDGARFRNARVDGVLLSGASAYGHVFTAADELPSET